MEENRAVNFNYKINRIQQAIMRQEIQEESYSLVRMFQCCPKSLYLREQYSQPYTFFMLFTSIFDVVTEIMDLSVRHCPGVQMRTHTIILYVSLK